MVRKTNFTIPKEDGVEVVSDPKKTKRRLRTTGKEVPIHSSGKSGSDNASGSRRQTDGHIQAQASRHPPHGTEESHTLHFTETQEDAIQDLPADEGHPQSYVCAKALLYVITTLMDGLQTPMDEWLDIRSQYIYIILEMEGLTKPSNCSMCTSTMEVKCSDCIGGNYFCRACCLQAHKRSPFHRMTRWTGTHFTPISLHSLKFKLCFGHDGEPCPLTVEV